MRREQNNQCLEFLCFYSQKLQKDNTHANSCLNPVSCTKLTECSFVNLTMANLVIYSKIDLPLPPPPPPCRRYQTCWNSVCKFLSCSISFFVGVILIQYQIKHKILVIQWIYLLCCLFVNLRIYFGFLLRTCLSCCSAYSYES